MEAGAYNAINVQFIRNKVGDIISEHGVISDLWDEDYDDDGTQYSGSVDSLSWNEYTKTKHP